MLVLVVGASGVGKDTLIRAAQRELADDARFVFPRRTVTREAVAEIEDHDSLSESAFAAQQAKGAYALSWGAHGLHYGVPVSIMGDLAAGRVVVVNVSRGVAAETQARFAGTQVLLVEASPMVRAQRLAGRGRESASEIEARLAREVAADLPGAIRIDNSGARETGIARFVAALREFAGS